MKKIFVLLTSMFLLVGCIESIAVLSGGAANGKLVQSSLKSGLSYGIKKQTGKSPLQHALAFAEEKNPNKKKEKCISFIDKTNSEACAIINKQITLAQTTVVKKISYTKNVVKEKGQVVLEKTIEVKKSPRDFISALRTKIKEYDKRWIKRKKIIKTNYLNQ
jgi:hypothetical protein